MQGRYSEGEGGKGERHTNSESEGERVSNKGRDKTRLCVREEKSERERAIVGGEENGRGGVSEKGNE